MLVIKGSGRHVEISQTRVFHVKFSFVLGIAEKIETEKELYESRIGFLYFFRDALHYVV